MAVELKLREIPENYRIKLNKEQQKQLWNSIREKRGIKQYADEKRYSTQQLYNLKNKDLAYPVDLVIRELPANQLESVTFKGPHKSDFAKTKTPIQIPEELLTRIKYSVKTNHEGTPHYITSEMELANRFRELINTTFQAPTKTYRNKGRYEIRYPKFLHDLIKDLKFKEKLSAKIDEIGQIKDQKFEMKDQTVSFNEFNDKLYSREKSLALALHKKDSEKVSNIITQEAEKINELIK